MVDQFRNHMQYASIGMNEQAITGYAYLPNDKGLEPRHLLPGHSRGFIG